MSVAGCESREARGGRAGSRWVVGSMEEGMMRWLARKKQYARKPLQKREGCMSVVRWLWEGNTVAK